VTELAVLVPLLALAGGGVVCLGRTPVATDRLSVAAAPVVAGAALVLAALALAGTERHTRWLEIDAASGLFVAVIAVVGLCSALVSPSYLRTGGAAGSRRRARGGRTTPRSTRSGPRC
jgi:formate hydrogenlyase subunit 3/multisubunit Na+/H+ antiporter MnhD subunit